MTERLFTEAVIVMIRHPFYGRDIPVHCWTMDQLETVRQSSEIVALHNERTWRKTQAAPS